MTQPQTYFRLAILVLALFPSLGYGLLQPPPIAQEGGLLPQMRCCLAAEARIEHDGEAKRMSRRSYISTRLCTER